MEGFLGRARYRRLCLPARKSLNIILLASSIARIRSLWHALTLILNISILSKLHTAEKSHGAHKGAMADEGMLNAKRGLAGGCVCA